MALPGDHGDLVVSAEGADAVRRVRVRSSFADAAVRAAAAGESAAVVSLSE
jgi:hypothetical protein